MAYFQVSQRAHHYNSTLALPRALRWHHATLHVGRLTDLPVPCEPTPISRNVWKVPKFSHTPGACQGTGCLPKALHIAKCSCPEWRSRPCRARHWAAGCQWHGSCTHWWGNHCRWEHIWGAAKCRQECQGAGISLTTAITIPTTQQARHQKRKQNHPTQHGRVRISRQLCLSLWRKTSPLVRSWCNDSEYVLMSTTQVLELL